MIKIKILTPREWLNTQCSETQRSFSRMGCENQMAGYRDYVVGQLQKYIESGLIIEDRYLYEIEDAERINKLSLNNICQIGLLSK